MALGECQLARSYRQLAEWLTELRDIKTGATPLADRLTAEERERIRASYIRARAFYKAENGLLKEDPEHEYQGAAWRCQMELLESIFGAEMFAEEGGSDV